MDLWHATTKSNVASIITNGLDPHKATGKIKGVWLHTRSKREWAILHTQKRHSVDLDQIALLKVSVDRKHLTRRWRGLWSANVTIKQIKNVTFANELY